ncbi:Alpha/beta hydrolase fold-1 [Xylariaceae sp. FL1651]|nr:Alpha/beta hydrolase fold-1 [Xylariaceae sp. FL1651]
MDATLVFVHGAWHSTDCWDDVRVELGKKGWETEAVAHPSPGGPSTNVSLEDDAQVTRQVLQRLCDEGKKIVLVVHSYGGCPGATASEGFSYRQRAAEGKKGGIVMFVYLAAFVIPKAKSLTEALGGHFAPFMVLDEETDWVTVDSPDKVFYHDVEPEMKSKFVQLLRPEPKRVFLDPVTYEPWADMPCAYLYCKEDQAIPIWLQQKMASQIQPEPLAAEFEGSHSPFLSNPGWVVEKVEWLAKAGLEKV